MTIEEIRTESPQQSLSPSYGSKHRVKITFSHSRRRPQGQPSRNRSRKPTRVTESSLRDDDNINCYKERLDDDKTCENEKRRQTAKVNNVKKKGRNSLEVNEHEQEPKFSQSPAQWWFKGTPAGWEEQRKAVAWLFCEQTVRQWEKKFP